VHRRCSEIKQYGGDGEDDSNNFHAGQRLKKALITTHCGYCCRELSAVLLLGHAGGAAGAFFELVLNACSASAAGVSAGGAGAF
jgi:hypothetical protein